MHHIYSYEWKAKGFIIILLICGIEFIDSVEIDLIEDLSHLPSSKPLLHHSTVWSLNLTGLNNGNNYLSQNATDRILKMFLRNNGFSICVTLIQNISNSGTIFSINYQGKLRYFEIKVNLKRRFVKVLYFPDGRVYGYRVEKLSFNLTDEYWKQFCIEFNNNNKELSIKVECKKVSSIILRGNIPSKNFEQKNKNEFKIWIGQKGSKKGLFKGILKKMIFSDNSKFSKQYCESKSVPSPEFNQYQSLLKRLDLMEMEMRLLKEELTETKKNHNDNKQCQCFPQCFSTSEEKKVFGDTWFETPCSNCTCTLKGTICQTEKCAKLSCKVNITNTGRCCPRCAHNCQYQKKTYPHNETFLISCMECSCYDGTLSCRRINPETHCPKLKCHRFLQVKVKGQCCKKCKALNLCELSKCGSNAHCIVSDSVFGCQCKPGYNGNPYSNCVDVNECLTPNYCPLNNECVNTEGSYKCICKPGFIRLNSSSDICKATCMKTPCQNNSTCIGVDQCECRAGFNGTRCDIDIDECQLGIIKCPLNSECINIPGGYICQCILGYHSIRNDTLSVSFDHQCEDINECSGERGQDFYCEISSSCVNFPGGYRCIPKQEESQPFGPNCAIQKPNGFITLLYDGKELNLPESCKSCYCQNGMLTCTGIKCNCAADNLDRCCPQCTQVKCQSSNTLSVKIDNVMGLNCSLSQTSCNSPVCPRLSCIDPILLPGQCCKYCRSDTLTSCILAYSSLDVSVPGFLQFMSKCQIKGIEYKSGTTIILQNFVDGSCIKCLCWNSHFCCGKSFSCAYP